MQRGWSIESIKLSFTNGVSKLGEMAPKYNTAENIANIYQYYVLYFLLKLPMKDFQWMYDRTRKPH